jgi:hypothetical protein
MRIILLTDKAVFLWAVDGSGSGVSASRGGIDIAASSYLDFDGVATFLADLVS